MATLRKIVSTTALAASLGAAFLGLSAGISAAAPVNDPAVIPMDRGWGHGNDDWDGPQVYVNLPCVTGPAGFVTVCP